MRDITDKAYIRTLIALSGNKRLIDYEQEIFADDDLAAIYLHSLCKGLEWYAEKDTNACLVYCYTEYIIGGRWPEAEQILHRHKPHAIWDDYNSAYYQDK